MPQLAFFSFNSSSSGEGGYRKRASRFVLLMFIWLFCGTLFYAYAPRSDLGFTMGLFMAINIGYSIGFGFPMEAYSNYMIFSSVYVIIGASFVAMALSFFADKISEDHDNWFTNLMQRQSYEEAFEKGTSCTTKIKAVFIQYSAPIRAVSLWAAWIVAMGLYAGVAVEEWDWQQAQYFAVSTCSTGGHYGLPTDAPVWLFGLTAFMMLLGVPFMAQAMVSMSELFMDRGDLAATRAIICEEVDVRELVMLQKFGLENGDGVIDRAEFIILCMVRMGQDPQLIEFISDRFAELDEDGGGTLSIREITRGKYDIVENQIQPTLEYQKELAEAGESGRGTKPVRFKSTRFNLGDSTNGGSNDEVAEGELDHGNDRNNRNNGNNGNNGNSSGASGIDPIDYSISSGLTSDVEDIPQRKWVQQQHLQQPYPVQQQQQLYESQRQQQLYPPQEQQVYPPQQLQQQQPYPPREQYHQQYEQEQLLQPQYQPRYQQQEEQQQLLEHPTQQMHKQMPMGNNNMYPDGTYLDATYQHETYPNGTYQEGTYQNETYPDETYPDETYPDGTYPDGTYPDGTYPDETYPDGTYQEGAPLPDGTYQEGAPHLGETTYQEGTTYQQGGHYEDEAPYEDPPSELDEMSDRFVPPQKGIPPSLIKDTEQPMTVYETTTQVTHSLSDQNLSNIDVHNDDSSSDDYGKGAGILEPSPTEESGRRFR